MVDTGDDKTLLNCHICDLAHVVESLRANKEGHWVWLLIQNLERNNILDRYTDDCDHCSLFCVVCSKDPCINIIIRMIMKSILMDGEGEVGEDGEVI